MVLLEWRRPNIYIHGGDFMKTQTKKYVVLRDYDGGVIGKWETMSEAGRALGVTKQTIANNIVNKEVTPGVHRVKKSISIHGILAYEYEIIEIPEPKDMFINLDGEVWKTIIGFSRYEISNCGRIRTKSAYKIIRCDAGTYPHCSLVNDEGIREYKYVHRLVAEHFLPDWDPTLTVNHKDENKFNNNVSNLEMMTRSENSSYSAKLHKDTWGRPKTKI